MADSPYKVRVSAQLDRESVDQVYKELQAAITKMSGQVTFDSRAERQMRNQIADMLQMVDQAGELARVVGSIRIPGLDKVFDVTLTNQNGVLKLTQDLQNMETELSEIIGMGRTVQNVFQAFDTGKMKSQSFPMIASMTKEFSNRFGPDVGQAMLNSLRPYSEELADMISRSLTGQSSSGVTVDQYIAQYRSLFERTMRDFSQIFDAFDLGNISKNTDLSGAIAQLAPLRDELDRSVDGWEQAWSRFEQANGDLERTLGSDLYEQYAHATQQMRDLQSSATQISAILQQADTHGIFPQDIDKRFQAAATSAAKSRSAFEECFQTFQTGKTDIDNVNKSIASMQSRISGMQRSYNALRQFYLNAETTADQQVKYSEITNTYQSAIADAKQYLQEMRQVQNELKAVQTQVETPAIASGEAETTDHQREQSSIKALNDLYREYTATLKRIYELKFQLSKMSESDQTARAIAQASLADQESISRSLQEQIAAYGQLEAKTRTKIIEEQAAAEYSHRLSLQAISDAKAETAETEAQISAQQRLIEAAAKRAQTRLYTSLSKNTNASRVDVESAQALYSQLASGGYGSATSVTAINRAVDMAIAALEASNVKNTEMIRASNVNLQSAVQETKALYDGVEKSLLSFGGLSKYGFDTNGLTDISEQLITIRDLTQQYQTSIQSGSFETQRQLWQQLSDAINVAKDSLAVYNTEASRFGSSVTNSIAAGKANLASAVKTEATLYQQIEKAIPRSDKLSQYGFQPGELENIASQVVSISDEIAHYKKQLGTADLTAQEESWKHIQSQINNVNASLSNYLQSSQAFESVVADAEKAYSEMVRWRSAKLIGEVNQQTDTPVYVFATEQYNTSLERSDALLKQLNLTEEQFLSISTAAANAAADGQRRVAEATTKTVRAQERLASSVGIQTLEKQILQYQKSNSLAVGQYGSQLDSILAKLRTEADTLTQVDLQSMRSQFLSIQAAAKQVGLEGKTAFERIVGAYKKFGGWSLTTQSMSMVVRSIRQMINSSIEIEAALTQLQIVCGLTSEELEKVGNSAVDSAKKIGVSVTDLLGSVETYARLGYSIEDSMNLAEFTAMFSNIAAIDTKSATDSITSIMKAFDYSASDAEKITDILTKVGQEYAISAGELGIGLQNGGAALATANNTLEESVALLAAGNAAVQDASSVGNALKTTSLRIRGATAELEDAGEDVDEFAASTAKMRDQILALSGVDILEDAFTFKSTYQILSEIAQVWDQLSDVNRASLLEALAGKRNASVVSSILINLKDLEGAYEAASNAAGTTAKANEVYLQSTEGKLKQLSAAAQGVSSELFDSKALGVFVDFARILVDAFGVLAKYPALLLSIGSAIAVMSKGAKEIRSSTNMALTLFNPQDVESMVTSLYGLSAAQQKLVMTTKGLSAEKQADIIKTLQSITANKQMTTQMAEQMLIAAGLDAEKRKGILTSVEETQVNTSTLGLLKLVNLEKLKAALVTSDLSEEERRAILQQLQYNAAMSESITNGQAFSTVLKTNLATGFGKVMGWISIGTTLLTLFTAGWEKLDKKFGLTYKTQKENVEELADEYETLASSIDQANSKIDEMKDQLAELSRQHMSGVETVSEEDLDRLQARVELEERMVAALEEQAKYDQQELLQQEEKAVNQYLDQSFQSVVSDFSPFGDDTLSGTIRSDMSDAIPALLQWHDTLNLVIDDYDALEAYIQGIDAFNNTGLTEDALTSVEAMENYFNSLDPSVASSAQEMARTYFNSLDQEMRKLFVQGAQEANNYGFQLTSEEAGLVLGDASFDFDSWKSERISQIDSALSDINVEIGTHMQSILDYGGDINDPLYQQLNEIFTGIESVLQRFSDDGDSTSSSATSLRDALLELGEAGSSVVKEFSSEDWDSFIKGQQGAGNILPSEDAYEKIGEYARQAVSYMSTDAPDLSKFMEDADKLNSIIANMQTALDEQEKNGVASYTTIKAVLDDLIEAGIDYTDVLTIENGQLKLNEAAWKRVAKESRKASIEKLEALLAQTQLALSATNEQLAHTDDAGAQAQLEEEAASLQEQIVQLNSELELEYALFNLIEREGKSTFTGLRDLVFDTTTAGQQALSRLKDAIDTALDFRSTQKRVQEALDQIEEITGMHLNINSDTLNSQLQMIEAYLDGDIEKFYEFSKAAIQGLGVQVNTSSVTSFMQSLITLANSATEEVSNLAGEMLGLYAAMGLVTKRTIAINKQGDRFDVTGMSWAGGLRDLTADGFTVSTEWTIDENAKNAILEFQKDLDYASTSSSSSGGSDNHLSGYEAEYATLQHLRNMERISTQEYYQALNALSKKYYAALTVDIEDYRSVLEELFDLEQEIYEKQVADREHAIELIAARGDKSYDAMNAGDTSKAIMQQIELYEKLRDATHVRKQELLAQGVDPSSELIQDLESAWWDADNSINELYDQMLEHRTEFYDDFEEYADTFDLWDDLDFTKVDWLYNQLADINQMYEDGLIPNARSYQELVNDINARIYQEQKESMDDIIQKTMQLVEKEIRDQIEAYQEIVRLKKESLSISREEQEYQKSVRDKTKEISNIEQQIARLKLDDSREAAAERARLEEELAQLNEELADQQADHAYDAEVDMLERSEEAFTESKESEIDTQTKLYNLAIARLDSAWQDMANGVSATWDKLYSDLINANDLYGASIDELADKWANVSAMYQKYQGQAVGGNYTDSVLDGFQPDAAGNGNIYGLSASEISKTAALVAQMQRNADAWHIAGQGSAEATQLSKENEALARQVEAIIGRKLYKVNGVWHIGSTSGPLLFPTFLNKYHSGGIIGEDPTLKQKEMLAIFEKGEMALTDRQQNGAYRLVEFSTGLLERFGDALRGVNISELSGLSKQPESRRIKSTATQPLTFNPQIEVNISGANGSMAEARKFGKEIADTVLGSFADAFARRGVISSELVKLQKT